VGSTCHIVIYEEYGGNWWDYLFMILKILLIKKT
jgi:hypothetical protein